MLAVTGEAVEVLSSPVIQFGFAGLSVILLAIIVWAFRQIVTLVKESNVVISANTKAIEALTISSNGMAHELETQQRATYALRDTLMQRRCIQDKP